MLCLFYDLVVNLNFFLDFNIFFDFNCNFSFFDLEVNNFFGRFGFEYVLVLLFMSCDLIVVSMNFVGGILFLVGIYRDSWGSGVGLIGVEGVINVSFFFCYFFVFGV